MTTTPSPTQEETLATVYEIHCPKCRQTERLIVNIKIAVEFTAEGAEDITEDRCWESNDRAHCPLCGWSGCVEEATIR